MREAFAFDASALIAFLNDEDGADKVEDILRRAKENRCDIYMNKLNVLEIYYGVYREEGEDKAEDVLTKVFDLPLKVVDVLTDEVLREAGRLKANYRLSLADSVALAEAKTRGAQILTCDHHEFEPIERTEAQQFYWIR